MTAGNAPPRPKRGLLLLLLLLFFSPLLVAFLVYYGSSWRPVGRTNHGTLIEPPLPLPRVALPPADAQLLIGKWSLVYIGDGACDSQCRSTLYFIRQTQLSLGNLIPRVQRVWLATDHCCDQTADLQMQPPLIAVDAHSSAAAPLLAWVLLHSLPWLHKTSLFDKLQLRTALGEIFASLGLHGEDAWRTAAQVRLLLAQEDDPIASQPKSAAFWQDPDIRWLAGVNESEGKTYFNKEAFEELMLWLQVPALVKTQSKVDLALTEVFRAAKTAGYNVEKFLAPPKPLPLPKVKDVSV